MNMDDYIPALLKIHTFLDFDVQVTVHCDEFL